MQATSSVRSLRWGAAQVLVLAAIAAAGISFGRWAIPSGDSTEVVVSTPPVVNSRAVAARIVAVKFAQMDRADAAHERETSVATATEQAIIGLKLTQMDAQDLRTTAVAPAATGPSGSDAVAKRKLAQMDAREASYQPESSAPTAAEQAIVEQKLSQMDAQDAR